MLRDLLRRNLREATGRRDALVGYRGAHERDRGFHHAAYVPQHLLSQDALAQGVRDIRQVTVAVVDHPRPVRHPRCPTESTDVEPCHRRALEAQKGPDAKSKAELHL